MKILLASSSSGSRGGGELYLIYLGRALARRGHQVTLWASSHPRMEELCHTFAEIGEVLRCDYTNTYDRRLRSLASYLDQGSSTRVAESWRSARPDFIHINKQNLEDGLDLLEASRLVGLPSLSTIHLSQSAAYLKAVLAPLRDFVSRRALHRYRGLLVTVLEQRRRDLAAFLGDSPRLRMIPNGVPMFDLSRRDAFRSAKRAELGIPMDATLVVAVGRLVPQKRPLAFLEQARLIRKKNPAVRFLWVGDGALAPEWDAFVHEHRLEAVVQRLPWQKEVEPLLFAADVFLHVAEFEGLPLAILEAMSAGLPCAIASHLLAEMPFMPADQVLSVDPAGDWARALGQAERLHALGAEMRRLAEAEFSFDAMAQQYEALYRESIERSR